MKLKGGFSGCTWCHGKGCMGCDAEREKAHKRAMEPIFTADPNNPSDIELLKEVSGAEALMKAFGPGGGGIREVNYNAAIASVKQCMRNHSDGNVTVDSIGVEETRPE